MPEPRPFPSHRLAARAAGRAASIVATVMDRPAGDSTDDESASVESSAASADAAANQRGRASKWDRSPAPRDWRFYVGTLGKVLIASGVLLFGFVAYQLWGTGIATARAQNQLEDEFAELIAEPASPTGTTPQPDSSDDATDGATTGDGAPASTAVTLPISDRTVPATAPDGDDGPGSGTTQDLPPIERGGPLAKLEIPRIGLSSIVVPGVTLDDLADGPGHYPDTPLPGQLGNAAIAGHRTTHGAPFFDVDQLTAGDEIIVTMISGDRFVYEVTGTEIVEPSDYWVVATTDPTVAQLTLTSCHPRYEARQRIVIHSVLVPAESAPVGKPTYYELDQPSAPIPGDDPVITRDSGAASDDATTSTDTATSGVTSDATSGVTSDATGGAGLTSEPPAVAADATLTGGWFDDPDAFPHIAFWGALLALIAVGAYRLSRRVRHDSVGFVAGIVPFVVVLYFFYENVSRLLPPGL